ncbi:MULTISPECIES: Rrf2 family transcriptional regulator [Agrobacterium]|uniref:Rrf2 family transcriptional regulator n=1 Tax=Agrobacterium tumefaciens TaxID=358 RepID=A0AAE6BHF0_AGRTU|nr:MULTISPECIES: Rrf2 family transcriptional regulator [Agrobacterium]QCL75557.1 Rrf2 family transcriptional regulator [Agrobacterium tumefaciens]QCL81119.1 Rrf2 family transcriptional regulator [Agrobacterium tumefaciens]WCK04440.1 Rrf2 family transcriptional regulator [Agrobacterium tumefaciens]CUX58109.1 Putative HTH-Rrf2-type transcriptional regulator, 2Fe-2S cluster binding, siderophore biosynthesis protein [Agrobacterium sp. NCPPB 925]
MHLKRQTEIAFGILAVCARQESEIVSVQKVAQEIGATKDHTYQVVALLARNGLLQSERGPGGGLKLARDPQTVKLTEVLRLVQPELLGEGADALSSPQSETEAFLGRIVSTTSSFFARLLDRFTIADLIAPESNLRVSCLDCGLLASSQQATVSLAGDVRPEPLVAWRSGTRS